MARPPLLLLVLIPLAGCGSPPAPTTPAAAGPRPLWVFEASRPGSVVAAPVVTDSAVYLAAVHMQGLRRQGAVYALDPTTGKARWGFDRDGDMLATASTPLVAGGRVLFGEGMHGDKSCRLHCIDTTGRLLWTAPASDHIEGGPAEAGGLIVFPSGNDGLYAVDAATGAERWHFAADLHIDATPTVANGRVYVGSGISRRFKDLRVVCLELATGNPLWRSPVAVPAWGSPLVHGGRVYVGLGNGRLDVPAESPAGGMACFDAMTGGEVFTFHTSDAVFGKPVTAGGHIVFGCRDGHVYWLTLDGKPAFKLAVGGPVIGGPAADGNRVYAVTVPGRIVCLDAAAGTEVWRHELARKGAEPLVFSPPCVVGGRLYVAAEMKVGERGLVALYCYSVD
jgi:outer membrane protein assembly factor BamB